MYNYLIVGNSPKGGVTPATAVTHVHSITTGAAMTHFHNDDGDDGKPKDKHIDLTDQEYFELIAQILKDDDLNDDGYVDFYEFMKAQSRNLPNTDPEDNIVP